MNQQADFSVFELEETLCEQREFFCKRTSSGDISYLHPEAFQMLIPRISDPKMESQLRKEKSCINSSLKLGHKQHD